MNSQEKVVLMLALLSSVAIAQERYWLVVNVAPKNFMIRTHDPDKAVNTDPGNEIKDDYTPIPATAEVKCLKAPCVLYYFSRQTAKGAAPPKIPVNLVPNKWVLMSTATEQPEVPVMSLPRQVDNIGEGGRRGGREKGGTLCSGTIVVKAPACDEVIDASTFALEWVKPEGTTGHVEIRLAILDSPDTQPDSIAPISADIEAGQYNEAPLRNQIAALLRPDGHLRLQIDIRQSDSLRATRTVYLPTLQEQEVYQRKIAEANMENEIAQIMARMDIALKGEHWTAAARESLLLQKEYDQNAELDQYALQGLCRSGYEASREVLRAKMGPDALHVCSVVSDSSTLLTSAPPPVSVARKNRTGIALLIGNSDYPGDALQAVRHDIEGMKATLQALGLDVTETPNLDTAQQFRDTVLNFAKKQTADDIVFVYYSGHGMQVKGRTYLLGVNFAQAGRNPLAAQSNAFRLDDVLEQLESYPAKARIVVFDGCRNNIFTNDQNAELGDVQFRRKFPNTAVILADTPGRAVTSRADGELRSPFTESLIYSFSHTKGGIIDIFNAAKTKTTQLSSGQIPEMRNSDSLDPMLFAGSNVRATSDRDKEMLVKACPYYHNRSWDTYISMMNVAMGLSDDGAVRAGILTEIRFAGLVEDAGLSKDPDQAEKLWQEAAAIFPGRNWVRMQAALAALTVDDVESALAQLAEMPPGPDLAIGPRAAALWAQLEKSFPNEAQSARRQATRPTLPAAPECVEVSRK